MSSRRQIVHLVAPVPHLRGPESSCSGHGFGSDPSPLLRVFPTLYPFHADNCPANTFTRRHHESNPISVSMILRKLLFWNDPISIMITWWFWCQHLWCIGFVTFPCNRVFITMWHCYFCKSKRSDYFSPDLTSNSTFRSIVEFLWCSWIT